MSAVPWVAVDDVARHLGASHDTVYRWIEAKGLPAHKVGRLWKFKLVDVDGWVRGGDKLAKAKTLQQRDANGASQVRP